MVEREKNVKFLGYVEGDDMKNLLAHCEFFVMPSLYEGFGTTVLEAMASKVPSLISDIPALREIIKDKAVFCDPVDVFDITNKMKQLINNPLERQVIKDGYEMAKSFSWDKCAKETLKVYEKLAENNKNK